MTANAAPPDPMRQRPELPRRNGGKQPQQGVFRGVGDVGLREQQPALRAHTRAKGHQPDTELGGSRVTNMRRDSRPPLSRSSSRCAQFSSLHQIASCARRRRWRSGLPPCAVPVVDPQPLCLPVRAAGRSNTLESSPVGVRHLCRARERQLAKHRADPSPRQAGVYFDLTKLQAPPWSSSRARQRSGRDRSAPGDGT